MEEDAKAEDGFLRYLNTHLHTERGGGDGGEEDPPHKKLSLKRERINKDEMTNVQEQKNLVKTIT